MRLAILIFALFYSGIGLGPEEAQYWLWSRFLDWGYYSKPPGIAGEIFLGTQIFGNTELGVRAGALVLGTLLPLAVCHLAYCCGLKPATAFWAGVVMAVSPLGLLATYLATTDAGYALCWTLASAQVALALRRGDSPNYQLLGAIIAIGALFKWPIYLFWLLYLPFLSLVPRLRNRHLTQGILISLIGLLPSLYWNSRHGWVTFRHVWTTMRGTDVGPGHGNFWEFLGAQAALLSPVYFLLLIAAALVFLQRRRRLGLPLFFCGYMAFVPLAVYLALSLFHKMQGNWVAFAYPTAIVLLCWYAAEWIPFGKSYLLAGASVSIFLMVGAFSLPTIQSKGLFANMSIPYSANPFRPNLGWSKLEKLLKENGYDHEQHFLAGDRYQTSSILSFHSEGQKRAYLLNLAGMRRNQFSVWPSLGAEQLGKTGFFVIISERLTDQTEALQEQLRNSFRTVQFLGSTPLFSAYGAEVKRALVFRCTEFNGHLPTDPDKY